MRTIILLMILSVPVLAEPSKTSQWLINEPATMMDLGIMRLQLRLNAGQEDVVYSPIYDWENDRIVIEGNVTNQKTAQEARQLCQDMLGKTRMLLGISKSGESPAGSSLMHELFLHAGFRSGDQPDKLGEYLDSITEIRLIAVYTQPEVGSLDCTAPLLGSKSLLGE